jgi:hypothetical protein
MVIESNHTCRYEEPTMALFLFITAFIAILNGLAIAGRVHDSRDGADWISTDDGVRRPRAL